MKTRSNAKYCAWCGSNSGIALFCGVCYPLMDGSVKGRINMAIRQSSPKRARAIGIETLRDLQKSGVPMPARKKVERERSMA